MAKKLLFTLCVALCAIFAGCTHKEPGELPDAFNPTITAVKDANITSTSATLKAAFTGTSEVHYSIKGEEWASKRVSSTQTYIEVTIEGLTPNTDYTAQFYGTNGLKKGATIEHNFKTKK